MTRAELAAEVGAVVARLERLQDEVRTPDACFSPVEAALIEARVGVRRALDVIEAEERTGERPCGT